MWSAYRHGLNVTKLHCYNVTTNCARPARYRRKVIHEGRNLRIRGLDVTVRLNSMNSSSKSPQIDARNLEAHEKCCIFAMSNQKTGAHSK